MTTKNLSFHHKKFITMHDKPYDETLPLNLSKVEFVLISCSEVEKFSRPITVSVSDNSPVVAAVIACVVITVAVAMTALAVVKWKSISHFLWPKVSLPRHFEKVRLLSEFLPWI